jgi:hypothetical protein
MALRTRRWLTLLIVAAPVVAVWFCPQQLDSLGRGQVESTPRAAWIDQRLG